MPVLTKFKKSMVERLPSEQQFKQTIRNIKYSHVRKAYSSGRKADNVRAIFEILERDLGCEENLSSEYTNIEHCYPDSVSEENDVIGNLMLLEKHLEEKCKDKSIEQKKEYYRQTKLKMPIILVKKIADDNCFNIDKRTDEIADSLYRIINQISNDQLVLLLFYIGVLISITLFVSFSVFCAIILRSLCAERVKFLAILLVVRTCVANRDGGFAL